MNSYLPQSLVWDHIKESLQQAAEARQATAVRAARRRAGTRARRAGHRPLPGA